MSQRISLSAVVVLQARTASRRLPGKVLETLAGRPLIAHCVERLQAANVGRVVLATTTSRTDDLLASMVADMGIDVIRGHEIDVLERFITVLQQFPADVALRATGDNPAVDVDSPRRVARALETSLADYVVESDLPYGAAVEAVRSDALTEAHAAVRNAEDREHVTTWVKRHPETFRVRFVSAPHTVRRPDLRLTVDTQEDLAYMRRVLARSGPFGGMTPLDEIIRLADRIAAPAEVA